MRGTAHWLLGVVVLVLTSGSPGYAGENEDQARGAPEHAGTRGGDPRLRRAQQYGPEAIRVDQER